MLFWIVCLATPRFGPAGARCSTHTNCACAALAVPCERVKHRVTTHFLRHHKDYCKQPSSRTTVIRQPISLHGVPCTFVVKVSKERLGIAIWACGPADHSALEDCGVSVCGGTSTTIGACMRTCIAMRWHDTLRMHVHARRRARRTVSFKQRAKIRAWRELPLLERRKQPLRMSSVVPLTVSA